jgi:hypothetical protein
MGHGRQAYTVLLILTDGSVTDVEKTKRSLFEASQSPLSIVIVGLGNDDFTKMSFIADFDPLPPDRDIAHFVKFRCYRDNHAALARDTLEKIPVQLVDYFFSRGFMPLSPGETNDATIEPEDRDETDDIVHDSNDNQNLSYRYKGVTVMVPPPVMDDRAVYAGPTPPSYPLSPDRTPPPASPHHMRSVSQPLTSLPLLPSSMSNRVAFGQSPHRPVLYNHDIHGCFGHENGQLHQAPHIQPLHQSPLPPITERLNLQPRTTPVVISRPLHASPVMDDRTVYAGPTPPPCPLPPDRTPPLASLHHVRSVSQPSTSLPLLPSSMSNRVAFGQFPHRPVLYNHDIHGCSGHENGQLHQAPHIQPLHQSPLPPITEILNLQPRTTPVVISRPLPVAQPLPFGIPVRNSLRRK